MNGEQEPMLAGRVWRLRGSEEGLGCQEGETPSETNAPSPIDQGRPVSSRAVTPGCFLAVRFSQGHTTIQSQLVT